MTKEEALNGALLSSPQVFSHAIPTEQQEQNSTLSHRPLDCTVFWQERILNVFDFCSK